MRYRKQRLLYHEKRQYLAQLRTLYHTLGEYYTATRMVYWKYRDVLTTPQTNGSEREEARRQLDFLYRQQTDIQSQIAEINREMEKLQAGNHGWAVWRQDE